MEDAVADISYHDIGLDIIGKIGTRGDRTKIHSKRRNANLAIPCHRYTIRTVVPSGVVTIGGLCINVPPTIGSGIGSHLAYLK